MKTNTEALIVSVIGFLFYLFALVDFCGMFFHYDLTGFAFSPLIAGLIGTGLLKWADDREKELKAKEKSKE